MIYDLYHISYIIYHISYIIYTSPLRKFFACRGRVWNQKTARRSTRIRKTSCTCNVNMQRRGSPRQAAHATRTTCHYTHHFSKVGGDLFYSALPPLPHLHLPVFCTLYRARSDFRCLALLERPPPSVQRAEFCAQSAEDSALWSLGGGRLQRG